MNVGLEIVSSLLNGDDVTLLTDSGFGIKWLDDFNSGSQVIFTGKDKQAYSYILEYYRRHRKVPPLDIFRQSYPEESYRLSPGKHSLPELIEIAVKKVNSFLIADLVGKVLALHDKGHVNEAIELLDTGSSKLSSSVKVFTASGYDITDPSFDINTILDIKMEIGVPFGVTPVDDAFYGFQPGQLITLVGRQKSAKSWLTLNSALHAWTQGYSVLFFSVEMGTDILQQRILCLGSNVSPSRMRRGKLNSDERQRVTDFQSEFSSSESPARFIISKKKTLITVGDILEEIRHYRPDVVYIDGFSFMLDSKTGKMTDDWQANENVSAELKSLCMEQEIVVFVNTQVQEKQYTAKNGIEARTIAGGTGLLKASDLVIGLNKEEDIITITTVLTRFEDFHPVKMEIDWETMQFELLTHPESKTEKLKEMGV